MMKTTTLIRILFFSLIIFTQYSCEVEEDSDFEVLAFKEPVKIDKANYFPIVVGNTWEYVTAQGKAEMLEVKPAEEFDGELFYEINQFNGKYAAIRKNGSTYELRLQGEGVKSAGYDMIGTFYKVFLFDHNAPTGALWEATADYTVSFIPRDDDPVKPAKDYTVSVLSEILDRDLTLKIKDVVYEDVIKVRLTVNAIGTTTITTYYFADGVGIVKFSEGINSIQLMDYNFKK